MKSRPDDWARRLVLEALPALVESDKQKKEREAAEIAAIKRRRDAGEVVGRESVAGLMEVMTAGHAARGPRILARMRRKPAVRSLDPRSRAAVLDDFEAELRADVAAWRDGLTKLAEAIG